LIASEGPAVEQDVANAAPILNVNAPALGPQLNSQPVSGLPPELQPLPGDILLSRAFWPWEDLGAEGIPEHWLYMSRHVQGVVAMLSVQTDAGPKLVKANPDGSIVAAQSAPAYDWMVSNVSAKGGVALVPVAPPPGKTIVVASLTASLLESSDGVAVANSAIVNVFDGVTTLTWGLLGVPATNGITDRIELSGLLLRFADGATVTIAFNAGLPNIFQHVAMAGFYQ
jgi:hypothetical protein